MTTLDLRKLRAFVYVAEERHFGRAAERLFVAQPALSQTIKALEAQIGVQLLDRSTRRVDLTPAGARLLERAHGILDAIDDAVAEARRIDAGEQGSLRLGFIGSASFGLMPALARAVGDALPLPSSTSPATCSAPRSRRACPTGRSTWGCCGPSTSPPA